MAVPPATLDPVLFSDYEQLKRFFYIFLFRDTPGLAEKIVAADGIAFIRWLWQDWSPGFDAADCLEHVRESLAEPTSLSAAISCYRVPQDPDSPGSAGPHEAEAQAAARRAPQPTLYLHGTADGCVSVDLVRNAEHHLGVMSRTAQNGLICASQRMSSEEIPAATNGGSAVAVAHSRVTLAGRDVASAIGRLPRHRPHQESRVGAARLSCAVSSALAWGR